MRNSKTKWPGMSHSVEVSQPHAATQCWHNEHINRLAMVLRAIHGLNSMVASYQGCSNYWHWRMYCRLPATEADANFLACTIIWWGESHGDIYITLEEYFSSSRVQWFVFYISDITSKYKFAFLDHDAYPIQTFA